VTGDLPGTSGGVAVIYPPLPISTPLNSHATAAAENNTDRHATNGPM